jgi:hypothetical protein
VRSFDPTVPMASERYTLTANQLKDTTVELNRKRFGSRAAAIWQKMKGEPIKAGHVSFARVSIGYLSITNAGNRNCR